MAKRARRREWLGPLGAALVVGVLAWLLWPPAPRDDAPLTVLDPDGGDPTRFTVPNATVPGLVFVFPQQPSLHLHEDGAGCPRSEPAPTCHSDPIVVVAPRQDGPSRLRPGHNTPYEARVQWWSDAVGLVRPQHHMATCMEEPCPQPSAPWILNQTGAAGPRFGVDGHNATRLVVYVLARGGEVIASNDLPENVDRIGASGDFQDLPDGPWYLGDGPAPQGMFKPPREFADVVRALRPAILGQGSGYVATQVAERHQYDWLVGPVTITARIVDVLPAE